MTKFTEIPLEILKRITSYVDKDTTKSLILTCRKFNYLGYDKSVILNFINEYMRPLEQLSEEISSKDKTTKKDNNSQNSQATKENVNTNKYLSIIKSFYHYLIKYRPNIEYARKKYILLYNAIALNNRQFFYFICSRISFYPSIVCFNAFNLSSKTGLVDVFNFFIKHTHMIQYSSGDKDFSFIKEKDYFNFLLNACQGGHFDIIDKLFLMENSSLIIKPINTIAHSNIAFDTACENGYLKIVELLMHRTEMNNVNNWDNAMKKTIDNHHFDVAVYLVTETNRRDKSLISNNTRNYAFRIAIQKKSYRLTDALLVEASLITNINWSFSIKNALINEDVKLLYILLDHISQLKNKDKIINTNTSNSIMKLIAKKHNSDLLPLMKKIINIPDKVSQDLDEIIESILLKKSCTKIENLLYLLILKLNKLSYPSNINNIFDTIETDNLSKNFILSDNNNNNNSKNKNNSNSNTIASTNYKEKINTKNNNYNNINNINNNNNIHNINENIKINHDNIKNESINYHVNKMISENDYPSSLNTNLNTQIPGIENNSNSNKNEILNSNNSLCNLQLIPWLDLTNTKEKVELNRENWSKCVNLSVTECSFDFLYYLLYSYQNYTSCLSVDSWNKIFTLLLSSYKMNIFGKVYRIKSSDILLSPSTVNLLIKVLLRQHGKYKEILMDLSDQELNYLTKENLNSILCFSVDNKMDSLIEQLLQYRYKDLITAESKEYCLKVFVQSGNTKLFKLLLLQDKKICTTTNRNFIYSHGTQEMKCFFNSV